VIDGLVVYPERMRANLEITGGLVYSQQVLLALTKAGVARDDAYRMVQRNAMRAWTGEGRFKDALLADADVTSALTPEMIGDLFSLDHHLAHVDAIFARVFRET
jgi:adenylosuccinate lyase